MKSTTETSAFVGTNGKPLVVTTWLCRRCRGITEYVRTTRVEPENKHCWECLSEDVRTLGSSRFGSQPSHADLVAREGYGAVNEFADRG